MRTKTVLTVAVAVILAFSARAGAIMVPIVNAGFEDKLLQNPDGYDPSAPPGWTQIGWEGAVAGTWRVTDDDFSPEIATEGQNVAYTETPWLGSSRVGLQQILDTPFAPGKNYTLTVDVGNSWYYYFSGYKVQLLAGDTVIAQDDNTLHPDWRDWATSTVEYKYDPVNFNDSLVGELLGIRLINLGLNPEDADWNEWVGVEFDNVRLENDTIPTPEPATMLLLGTGLLGLAGIGRKKLFPK